MAEVLVAELAPYCNRLEIVGSLRRLRPDVGDIELLADPILEDETDMFGDRTGAWASLLDERLRQLLRVGTLEHRPDKNGRPAFGLKYKRLSYHGMALDLFSVIDPAQWGVLSLIRTGSADWAHRLVTPVEHGGWCPTGYCFRDGAIWTVDHWEPLETPTEHDVFQFLRRPYVEPNEREVRP